MHRVIGGIAPAEPGYRVIRYAPNPGGSVTWARAELKTPYGPAGIRWQASEKTLTINVIVPPGTRGIVISPSVPKNERLGPEVMR
ncbi:alpha-L-rhamnosidase C-terminal domain-containing protein [Arthrobacter sp. SA17]